MWVGEEIPEAREVPTKKGEGGGGKREEDVGAVGDLTWT